MKSKHLKNTTLFCLLLLLTFSLASCNGIAKFQLNNWSPWANQTATDTDIENRQSKLPLNSKIDANSSASAPYYCGTAKTDQGYFPTVFTQNAKGIEVKLVHFKSNEFVDISDPNSIYTPTNRCKIFAKRLNDLSEITSPSDQPSLYLKEVNVKGAQYLTINYRLDNKFDKLGNCTVPNKVKCDGMLLTVSPSKSFKDAGYLIDVLKGSPVDATHKYESSKVPKLYLNDFAK